MSTVSSLNIGFTLLARGEFSIIIATLALTGGLMDIIQPFAALYVLILASGSPILAKESERIYNASVKVKSYFERKIVEETDEPDNEESVDAAVED